MGGIENLTRFTIDYQHSLTTIDVFADLSSLEYLRVGECALLRELPLNRPTPALRELTLAYLPALTRIELGSGAMPQLDSVTFLSLEVGEIVGPVNAPALTCIRLSVLPKVRDFTWLGAAPNLKHLACWNLTGLATFAGATDFSSLLDLRIEGESQSMDLAQLPALPSLVDLRLATRDIKVTTLAGLPDLPALEHLELEGFPGMAHLSGLPPMPDLTSCTLSCNGLVDLTGFAATDSCRTLRLWYCGGPASLEGLAAFPALKELNIESCRDLVSFGTPVTLPALEDFVVYNCANLPSLGGRPVAPMLRNFRLRNCAAVTDLSGPVFPASLDTLVVAGNAHLTSLDGLEEVQAIDGLLELARNAELASLAGLTSLQSVGDVEIYNNPALNSALIFDLLQGVVVTGRVVIEHNGH
jgi:hypothetical protein